MKPTLFPALAAFVFVSTPAHAVPGGQLTTLGLGTWVCELPGDATTPPIPQPEHNFTAIPDSSYTTANGESGTYLLLGDDLTFTSGIREGQHFLLESDATIHKVDKNGVVSSIRCVLAGVPTAMAPAAAPRPAEEEKDRRTP